MNRRDAGEEKRRRNEKRGEGTKDFAKLLVVSCESTGAGAMPRRLKNKRKREEEEREAPHCARWWNAAC